MKMRIGAAVLVLATGTMVFGQESRPAGGGGGQRGNRPQMPNGLGGAMRDMGAVMQRLAKEVADPAQKDAALTDVILMQRDAAIAKTGIPNNVRNLTGDDKAKKLGEFRADMTKLVKALLDFEDNIAAGNADAIKASEAKLGDIMKAGHAEFKPEE
jgi:soluble cytochrome b562